MAFPVALRESDAAASATAHGLPLLLRICRKLAVNDGNGDGAWWGSSERRARLHGLQGAGVKPRLARACRNAQRAGSDGAIVLHLRSLRPLRRFFAFRLLLNFFLALGRSVDALQLDDENGRILGRLR